MNVERLKSTLATGGEHLGDLIFWTLADARIDRKALESLWSAAQLGVELLPDPPTAERALKLAVREAHAGRVDCLIRLAKEDEAELVFAVVREHRPGDGSLDYDTEARITLDREHGRFGSGAARACSRPPTGAGLYAQCDDTMRGRRDAGRPPASTSPTTSRQWAHFPRAWQGRQDAHRLDHPRRQRHACRLGSWCVARNWGRCSAPSTASAACASSVRPARRYAK